MVTSSFSRKRSGDVTATSPFSLKKTGGQGDIYGNGFPKAGVMRAIYPGITPLKAN